MRAAPLRAGYDARRKRNEASIGRAATTRALPCRPAIRPSAPARCDRDARCRAWAFSYPGTGATGGGDSAMCWLKNEVKPPVENPCCVTGVKGGGIVESVRADRDRDRPLRRRLSVTSTSEQSEGRRLQADLRGREPLPGLDLRAAGLSREPRRAATSRTRSRAAAQAVLHVGRGAVATAETFSGSR